MNTASPVSEAPLTRDPLGPPNPTVNTYKSVLLPFSTKAMKIHLFCPFLNRGEWPERAVASRIAIREIRFCASEVLIGAGFGLPGPRHASLPRTAIDENADWNALRVAGRCGIPVPRDSRRTRNHPVTASHAARNGSLSVSEGGKDYRWEVAQLPGDRKKIA